MHPLLALALAATLSAIAWWLRALTPGGALAAACIGTVILAETGWPGALVLGTFFFSSVLVGRLVLDGPERETRSAIQVLANGGPAAIGSLCELIAPSLGAWIVTASLAAAGSDTWATTLGRSSPTAPILLGTGQRVSRGTSGGVTLLGTIGGAAGALLVAVSGGIGLGSIALTVAGSLIGFGGMFLDSLLGARLQGRFTCPTCQTPTEGRRHCGSATVLERGWAWLDNDGVNLLTTLLAALAGAAAWALR